MEGTVIINKLLNLHKLIIHIQLVINLAENNQINIVNK
jgi:hypothetical protein